MEKTEKEKWENKYSMVKKKKYIKFHIVNLVDPKVPVS